MSDKDVCPRNKILGHTSCLHFLINAYLQ